MKTMKIRKIIEEVPFKDGLDLVLSVLKKPKDKTEKEWEKEVISDLLTGKKFLSIREIKVNERIWG